MQRVTVLEPGRGILEYGTLSRQEIAVMGLLLEHLSNKAIAAELRISEHTVKDYVARLMRGLRVPSRCGLVAYSVTYPQIFLGSAAPIGLHPAGCLCGGHYCAVVRAARLRRAKAAA